MSRGDVVKDDSRNYAMGTAAEHTRATIKWSLRHLRKVREAEEAAKELPEAVQDRKQQLENETWKRGGRLHFLVGAGTENIGDPERKNLAIFAEQQYKIREPGAGLQ